MRRTLRDGWDRFTVVPFHESLAAGHRLIAFTPGSALAFLQRLACDFDNRDAFRSLLADRGGLDLHHMDDQEVVRQLAWMLESGSIKIAAQKAVRLPVSVVAPSEVPTPAASPQAIAELTWLDIMLVDEEGRGVRQEFELTGPGGVTVLGSTDAHGYARVENLKRGAYQVTFPKLDGKAWGKA